MLEKMKAFIRGGNGGEDRAFGLTDVGQLRQNNEDAFVILPGREILVVADGMGGHNAGEVASALAIQAVGEYFTPEVIAEMEGDPEKAREHLNVAVLDANRRVFEAGREHPEQRGMGCALVVAFVHAGVLHTSHVGDVRAYVCKASGLVRVTNDHTEAADLVRAGILSEEEAMRTPVRNILTQAIGSSCGVEPEYNRRELEGGDRVLLCSDGLWDMVPDRRIREIVSGNQKVKDVCRALVAQANIAGGKDNITAVVLEA